MTAEGCKLRIGNVVGYRFWVSLSVEEYNLLKTYSEIALYMRKISDETHLTEI